MNAIAQMFLDHLVGAIQTKGRLMIYRPTEATEEVDLRTATVTYAEDLREVVIHNGLRSTTLRPIDSWQAIQFLPGAQDRSGKLLFRKTADLAFEIVPGDNHV